MRSEESYATRRFTRSRIYLFLFCGWWCGAYPWISHRRKEKDRNLRWPVSRYADTMKLCWPVNTFLFHFFFLCLDWHRHTSCTMKLWSRLKEKEKKKRRGHSISGISANTKNNPRCQKLIASRMSSFKELYWPANLDGQ